MATVTPSISRKTGYATVTWSALAAGDVGALVDLVGYRLRSVSITGTFGGNLTLEGTDLEDGTGTLVGLKDRSGTAVSASAAGMYQFPESLRWIRPNAGTGVSAVTVSAFYEPIV